MMFYPSCACLCCDGGVCEIGTRADWRIWQMQKAGTRSLGRAMKATRTNLTTRSTLPTHSCCLASRTCHALWISYLLTCLSELRIVQNKKKSGLVDQLPVQCICCCGSDVIVASAAQDLLEEDDEEEDDAPLDNDWGLQDSGEPGPPV